MQQARRWIWFGVAVEAFKPVVGAAHGLSYFVECVDSAAHGVYEDILAHYNWLRSQERFAAEVAQSLEQLSE